MLKETIYLHHTPIDEALEYLISEYGFRPDRREVNSLTSHLKALAPITSIIELGTSTILNLTIEKEGQYQKLTFTASHRNLNLVFVIMTLITVGLTLLIFSWPYLFLFMFLPLVVYISGRFKYEAYFLSFCEKLKNELVHLKASNS